MKNMPFFTGLIVVLCGVACWLGAGNKQAPPAIDNNNLPAIIATIEVPPQTLQAYKFKRRNKETFMQNTMILAGSIVASSILLIILAPIIDWGKAKWDLLETQRKARAVQKIQQEVSKWANEDIGDAIHKAEDYYTAWELLRDVNRQGDKLMIDCLKHGEQYPDYYYSYMYLDYFEHSSKILFLKAGYYANVEKVSKQMQQARAAFNKNTSVHIFFLEGWCREHIQSLNLHQIDKHILVMIYNHIEAPKLSLITSAVYTAEYHYSCAATPGKLLTYTSLYLPPKR